MSSIIRRLVKIDSGGPSSHSSRLRLRRMFGLSRSVGAYNCPMPASRFSVPGERTGGFMSRILRARRGEVCTRL